MRVPALSRIYEPGVVIADKFAVPIFVLNVINGMRSYNDAIVLPELYDAFRVFEGVFSVGNNVIAVRKRILQECYKAFFASVYWSFTVFW
jgi:hypothetical protein